MQVNTLIKLLQRCANQKAPVFFVESTDTPERYTVQCVLIVNTDGDDTLVVLHESTALESADGPLVVPDNPTFHRILVDSSGSKSLAQQVEDNCVPVEDITEEF